MLYILLHIYINSTLTTEYLISLYVKKVQMKTTLDEVIIIY